MHFQSHFGLDALEKITERQYRRWVEYFRVNGAIWWKRHDWNYAKVITCVSGGKVGDNLLQLRCVKNDPTENIISMVGAFGGMTREDVNELREAAEKYG